MLRARVGLFTVVIVYAIPMFVDEVSDASATLPGQDPHHLQARLEPWFATQLHIKLPHSVNDLSKAAADRLQGEAAWDTARTALFGTLGYVGVALSALASSPVFAGLYLLIDFDRIVNKVEQLIPRRWSPGISSVARDIHKTLSGYVRGQLTANVVLAALYATGLRMVDIRLAVPIGVLTGMLAFVPYVGFTIGLLLALSMAILDWQSAGTVLGVIIVMGGVQIIDAMIITPRIVGRSVGLAPLEVILTMMTAGALFGFLGVLLAVPLGAVAKILIQRGVRAYLDVRVSNRAPPTVPLEIEPITVAIRDEATRLRDPGSGRHHRRRASAQEIALTRIAEHRHDGPGQLSRGSDDACSMHICARRRPDQQPFFAREPARHRGRLGVADADDLVDDGRVEDRRNEARAKPLDGVNSRLSAGKNGARVRLDGDDHNVPGRSSHEGRARRRR